MNPGQQVANWPTGHGDMARRVREHDWAATPLGPVKGWPQSLRTTIDTVLACGFPTIALWGPELVQIYNDGYRQIMGGKHPAGLGQATRDCWPEVWRINEPIYERVRAGETLTFEDRLYPITPHGVLEDAWFTLSYGPLRDEAGAVAGVLVTVFETTDRVLAERQRDTAEATAHKAALVVFRSVLSDALRSLARPTEIQAEAARLLGEYLGASRAHYAEVEPGGDRALVLDGYAPSKSMPTGCYRLADYTTMATTCRGGRTYLASDLAADPDLSAEEKAAFALLSVVAIAVVPLVKGRRLVALLAVHLDAPHVWTPEEVELIEDAAERTWSAVERARSERALRESEERFRGFAEASSNVLWILDAETQRLEYLSPAYEQVWGEGREGILTDLGRWAEMILPEDLPQAGQALEAALRGQQRAVEYRIRRADGDIRHIRDTGFPILDDEGRVWRAGGIAQDISERREAELALENSEERLRTLVEGIPQLVWRSRNHGRWTWASAQWQVFTGQSQEQSLGLGWLDVVHPDDHETAVRAWHKAQSQKVLDVEYRIRRASDGSYLWHHIRSTPVPARGRGGRVQEWLGTSTDVHQTKRIQQQQEAMMAELRHRTGDLISSVTSMTQQTMAETGPTKAFQARLFSRLAALARVQDLLSHSDEDPITLEAVLRMELDALKLRDVAPRITLAGPVVGLPDWAVQPLALTFHELATTARTHGALSTSQGRLQASWHTYQGDRGQNRLTLDWTEAGGTPQVPLRHPRESYGRELIEHVLPHTLNATTRYEITEASMCCSIDVPLTHGDQQGSRRGAGR